MIVLLSFAKAINFKIVMAFLEATELNYSYYCLFNSSFRQDVAVGVHRSATSQCSKALGAYKLAENTI